MTQNGEQCVGGGTVCPRPWLWSCGNPGQGRVFCSIWAGSASELTIPNGSPTGAPGCTVSEAEISNMRAGEEGSEKRGDAAHTPQLWRHKLLCQGVPVTGRGFFFFLFFSLFSPIFSQVGKINCIDKCIPPPSLRNLGPLPARA